MLEIRSGRFVHSMPTPQIIIDCDQYIRDAEALFSRLPKEVNGMGTIRLLLFVDPVSGCFIWYPLGGLETVTRVVKAGIDKKGFLPIGACFLSFEQRDNDRIYLRQEVPIFVHEHFDAEEVLNGTVPYFMKEKLNYDISSLKAYDPEKN